MNRSNVVVLRGRITAEPSRRELASGAVVTQFDVAVSDGPTTGAVPVAWPDPPHGRTLHADQDVVVAGHVRRRFFRAGGLTQSRTEVVAERVVDARRRGDVARLVAAAADALGADPP